MDLTISSLSAKVGCHENALRLILSALLAYPLCVIYNLLLANKPVIIKHIYYTSCGLFLCYYNYGIDTIHSLVCCLFVYTVLALVGPNRTAVGLNLTFCMTYLLCGYYVTQIGSEYSFTWTIPQCVLTLRLIAMTFDVYDGHRNAKASKESPTVRAKVIINEDTAVDRVPSLLEVLSHAYYPGSFLIGPQVKYKLYLNYIESNENYLPKCWLPGVTRLVVGLIYLAIYQIGSNYWPPLYLTSQQFSSYGFFMKSTAIAIVTKIALCKYLSGWLIAEGAIILSGASYNPRTGSVYESANIHVIKYETTTTFGGLIRSFNLTTNEFAAKYIFKRLKFLGSRTASHFLTLAFLASWHGWKSGYYITFGMEFLIMKMEWEVLTLLRSWRARNKTVDRVLSAFYIRWPILVVMRLYTIYMFGYSLASFVLLTYDRWLPVLSQVYFCGHIIYGTWALVTLLFPFLVKVKQQ